MTHSSDPGTIEQHLQQLATETCRHPPGTLKRRQSFNRLIVAIHKSGKLWRENTPYYEEALQQTWVYLYRNLCQPGTGEQYDPERSRITTWLNNYLKRRLQDLRHQQKTPVFPEDPENHPLDQMVAPPEIPPILEETRHWAETDPDGILRQTHVRKRPEITAQLLILRRLPPETRWEALAAELDAPYTTLATFYQRKCLPILRKFGEDQGYL